MNLLIELNDSLMLSGKEPACQSRRLRFHPWVGKIPWRRKWQNPFRCFCLGNPTGRGATVHGAAESGNTTEYAGVHAYSPLFTDLGFFCFEVLCSLIQCDGLFKKSFWSLPSQRQVVRDKATRDYGRVVAYEQDRSFPEASMVGGKLTSFSLFVLKFPDFSTESLLPRNTRPTAQPGQARATGVPPSVGSSKDSACLERGKKSKPVGSDPGVPVPWTLCAPHPCHCPPHHFRP